MNREPPYSPKKIEQGNSKYVPNIIYSVRETCFITFLSFWALFYTHRILLGHPKDVYQTCAPKALTSLQGSDTVASLNGVVKALRCLER